MTEQTDDTTPTRKRKREHTGVFQRGTVWWIAYCHRGTEIRESVQKVTGKNTRAAAKTLLTKRRRTAGTPDFLGPAAERVTYDDLATLYLNDYGLNRRRSLRDAKRNVEQLRATFGELRALDITTDRIACYTAARLAEGRRPATVNRELAALRRMFALAVRAALLHHRPHIQLLVEDNVREGFLEPSDFAALRAYLPGWLVLAIDFLYLTGWRRSEMTTLTWADVDLRVGVIRLRSARSKNKRPRVLVLRRSLRAVLEAQAAKRTLDCPLVFHRDGLPLGDFRRPWRAACAAAGLGRLLVHDLRRSAIRNMIRAKVPERIAMAASGHLNRNVFDRYNIVSEQDLADAAEQTLAYVETASTASPSVVPLTAARRTHSAGEFGQFPDNQAQAGAAPTPDAALTA